MIDYIGDLSRADAELLRNYAQQSGRILEFGVGASTQILASYTRGTVDSVETDPKWIGKTHARLLDLAVAHLVTFHHYGPFVPVGAWDMIFVDGADELRQPFALHVWANLAVGGVMLFHDTRRTVPHGNSLTTDVENACAVIMAHSFEIERVVLNENNSNTTVITKRGPLLYRDWNRDEGRTPAQIGIA